MLKVVVSIRTNVIFYSVINGIQHCGKVEGVGGFMRHLSPLLVFAAFYSSANKRMVQFVVELWLTQSTEYLCIILLAIHSVLSVIWLQIYKQ